jgi:hypothetical protein
VLSRVPRTAIAVLLLAAALTPTQPAAAQALPELPRTVLDVQPPPVPARLVPVPAGADLQAAIDAAQPGDALLLAPGATYRGSFTLPAKSGDGWITIRTATPDGQLPAPGTRVRPEHAPLLAAIVATGVAPAISTAPGAHHYRLIGLRLTLAAEAPFSYGLVALGSAEQTSAADVPSHLVLDRVYVHGAPDKDVRRGVALNSAFTAIVDSWIGEIHEAGADSQAIAGWNGPGPFAITGNYLEAAGENVLFGGADPRVPGLVPSDIVVRRNHVAKPAQWRGTRWTVKNLFELKNAQRVLIEGNVFERNWLAGQSGYAVLFTPRNQDGRASWSVVQDVTFAHNLVRDVAAGINVLGRDNLRPSQPTRRIRIAHNVVLADGRAWGGSGRLLQLLDAPADVTVERNTVWQSGEMFVASGAPMIGFTFRDNVVPAHGYGVGGDGTFGNVALTLATFMPGAVLRGNLIVSGAPAAYPGNTFAETFEGVGLADPQGGDYGLAAASPYRGTALDGGDPGVDMASLRAALGGSAALVIGGRPPVAAVASCDAVPTALRATLEGPVLTVAWTAPPSPVAGYRLEAGTRPGAADIAVVALPAAQTSISAAVPPATYHVRVRAITGCGAGEASGEVIVRPGAGALPGAASPLSATVTGATVALAWQPAAGAIAYRLEIGTGAGRANLGASLLGPDTSLVVDGVPAGTYVVRVRAVSAAGTGPVSNDVVVRVR